MNSTGGSPEKHSGMASGKGLNFSVLDIINALPFYAIVVDSEHTIHEANQAVYSHLGFKREDILGKYCPLVIHGIDHPFEGCPLEEAVAENRGVDREILDKASGRWVASGIFPMNQRTHDGKRLYLHIVTDITARKKAEEQLQASHEQLRQLSAHLETVREDEKKRIARDLHDESSQLMASLKAYLQAAVDTLPAENRRTKALLKKSQDISSRVLDELVKIIYDLRPPVLDELGLLPAIRSLAGSRLAPAGIKFSVKSAGRVKRLAPVLEIALFRMVQEVFADIATNSRSNYVAVKMVFEPSRFDIRIKDAVRGANTRPVIKSKKTAHSVSLTEIEEKIKQVGGSLAVNTQPGDGTEIVVEVPL